MTNNPPPFIAGQNAFLAGRPVTDNPHDRDATFSPEGYPGDWANWRDGWMTAMWRDEHDKRRKGPK
jgi:hypothetical protein